MKVVIKPFQSSSPSLPPPPLFLQHKHCHHDNHHYCFCEERDGRKMEVGASYKAITTPPLLSSKHCNCSTLLLFLTISLDHKFLVKIPPAFYWRVFLNHRQILKLFLQSKFRNNFQNFLSSIRSFQRANP